MRLRSLVLAAVALAPLLAGCADVLPDREERSAGAVRVPSGRITVAEGETYEVADATVRLGRGERVVVDGVVEVRGRFVARDVEFVGLYNFVVLPGGSAVLDGVTVRAGVVAAGFNLSGGDVEIARSKLEVRAIEVSGKASVVGNSIRGVTEIPPLVWRGEGVAFDGNEVSAKRTAVVFLGASGVATGNRVVAGTSGIDAAIAVQGGSMRIESNTVTQAAVGIAFDRASGTAVGNEVSGTTFAGIAARGGRVVATSNTVDSAANGIAFEDSEAEASSNSVAAGTTGNLTAIGARRGSLDAIANTIRGAAIGIGGDRATVRARGNVVAGTTLAGIAVDRGTLEATENRVSSSGQGVVVLNATGEARRNVVLAGTSGLTAAIAVVNGSLVAGGNEVSAGGVGIAYDRAKGEASGNTVRGTATAGIASARSQTRIVGNLLEGNGRVGIYAEGGSVEIAANVVSGTTNPGAASVDEAAAAVAIQGGEVEVVANDFSGNDVAVAVLEGRPAVSRNNFEASLWYAVARVGVTTPTVSDNLDATNNWWGAPSGPLPPDASGKSKPASAGPDRVGPGVTYTPWLVQRRP